MPACGKMTDTTAYTPVFSFDEKEVLPIYQEKTLEELLDLVSESSKQTIFCAIKKGEMVSFYDWTNHILTNQNLENEINTKTYSERTLLEIKLKEMQTYENLSISIKIDINTIPQKTCYRISATGQNGIHKYGEDYFIDADTNLFIGFMPWDPKRPEQEYVIYKTWYSDDTFTRYVQE